jgi:carbonic anhydrase
VVRVAGNVVDADVTGSLEYAALHLGTRLLLVLGHEQCGAVTAVVDNAKDDQANPPGLRKLLERVRPALKGIKTELPRDQRIAAGLEANVRWSVTQLATVPGHKKALDEGNIALIGALARTFAALFVETRGFLRVDEGVAAGIDAAEVGAGAQELARRKKAVAVVVHLAKPLGPGA